MRMSPKILPQSRHHHNTGWRGPDLRALDAAFDRAFLAPSGSFHFWRLALLLLILPVIILGGLALLIFGAAHLRRFCISCQFGKHCGRCTCCQGIDRQGELAVE